MANGKMNFVCFQHKLMYQFVADAIASWHVLIMEPFDITGYVSV